MLDAIVFGAIVLAGTPDVTLADRVALMRIGTGQQQKPLSVFSHAITPGSTDCVGSLFASDPKVIAFSKKQLGRFMFTADQDGDGEDELLIVREKKKGDHPLDLRLM